MFERGSGGLAVVCVFVRAYEGRAVAVDADVVEGDSKREASEFVLEAIAGLGEAFVGESGASTMCEGVLLVFRELIHDLSSAAAGVYDLAGELAGSANLDCVDCFNGDPDGVAARTVDGERPSGDSGLLNGLILPLSLRPNDNGAGLRGLDGFDCTSA